MAVNCLFGMCTLRKFWNFLIRGNDPFSSEVRFRAIHMHSLSNFMVILCGCKTFCCVSREVNQEGIWCERRDSLRVMTSGSQLELDI